ncbi:hypothetical protein BDY19DRAFT_1020933 [Irpex rosettiformis]|uniref:Uncharacterized protein n=1 Tax=Irpex rosettiformis TaxID=378272 RepID=A0ACB8TU48_9APHY|nr:hypothetical protein BDY19DRAFT_1020933 [Irpex rosettiformis]
MPSFAELRERAAKARDTGLTKLHDTRDKYSSRSSKDASWNPDSRHTIPAPSTPPADPPHTSSAAPTRPRPPPPPRHGSLMASSDSHPDHHDHEDSHPPTLPSRSHYDQAQPNPPAYTQASESTLTPKVDWANMTVEDKETLFSWLDEFFESRFNITIPKRNSNSTAQVNSRPMPPVTAPAVNMSSRPTFSSTNSSTLDLASYFLPTTHWESAWYTSGELAPPLKDEASPNWTASWSSRGSNKTIHAGVLFSDLSMCWYSVSFSTISRSDPNDTRAVVRSARYLPRPSPQDRTTLVSASETYGETIAAFAESFVGSGQYCAQGECWDLANEALKQFDQYDYVPKPVPSIQRTHGHLIFEGKAENSGAVQFGRWRGGDDRIRRGDIVEWRNVRVKMGSHAYATLGTPDHTAIITGEAVPRVAVTDGLAIKPSEVGTLEVVEQSVGSPPKKERYDLSQLQEGEVWIYRPIAMEVYIGATLAAQCPDHVSAISV